MHRDSLSPFGNAARLAPAPSSTTCGGSDDFGCSAISPDPQFEASDIERYKFSFGHYIVGRPRRCDPVAESNRLDGGRRPLARLLPGALAGGRHPGGLQRRRDAAERPAENPAAQISMTTWSTSSSAEAFSFFQTPRNKRNLQRVPDAGSRFFVSSRSGTRGPQNRLFRFGEIPDPPRSAGGGWTTFRGLCTYPSPSRDRPTEAVYGDLFSPDPAEIAPNVNGHRICCGPDYVADSPYHPAAHENTPYLSNIISFTQSAARKAISPVFALHGRSDPDSAASQSAMALAFISMSISA